MMTLAIWLIIISHIAHTVVVSPIQIKNHQYGEYRNMTRQIFQIYLGFNDIAAERAGKILDRLNSLSSTEEVMRILNRHVEQNVFGIGMAQRILKTKAKIGKFQDLNQVATMSRIGPKKFSIMLSALDDHV